MVATFIVCDEDLEADLLWILEADLLWILADCTVRLDFSSTYVCKFIPATANFGNKIERKIPVLFFTINGDL